MVELRGLEYLSLFNNHLEVSEEEEWKERERDGGRGREREGEGGRQGVKRKRREMEGTGDQVERRKEVILNCCYTDMPVADKTSLFGKIKCQLWLIVCAEEFS